MRKVKTGTRGWVCAAGAVILSSTAALLSGCSGLVSGANNNLSTTLVISNVQTGSVTTSVSQVVWTTNVLADSSVDYGTTTAYGNSTPVDSATLTSHQTTLSALAPRPPHSYHIHST